ncbi:ATP-binding cassette subfamily G member 4-like [Dermatophagoides pteronyssinus]|uniref:ATP-binding cassette subfamily G member 4-like n=1 Tax=Dermatophagoides pteronyssinus TaxID=6956 RepID=UPI003F67EA64
MNLNESSQQQQQQQQTSILWRNLSYNYHNPLGLNNNNNNNEKSSILQCLNGHLCYQTLNGLLGPSGSGKTTLLKCLSGRIKSGLNVHTEIYLNSTESKRLTKTIRFIEQNDKNVYGQMTVRQILSYAFHFKNNQSHLYDIDSHISIIMNDLLLDETTILDRRFEQCSGGEQHRIIIAQELMSLKQPTFLFIDEPTTGLDSNSALLLMKCLWRLSQHNRMTIFVSIHSPNSDIMKLFDKIYILAKDGVCIYSDSPKYLDEKIGHQLNHDDDDNRLKKSSSSIEQIIRIACNNKNHPLIQKWTKLTLENENEQFNQIMMAKNTDVDNRLKFQPKGILIGQKCFHFKDLYIQLRRIFNIQFMIEWRNLMSIMLFYMIVFPFIASFFDEKIVQSYTNCHMVDYKGKLRNQTCYERLNNEINTNEYIIYLWYCQCISGYSIMILSTISISSMLKMFRNEHRNHWYHFGVLFIAITMITFIHLGLLSWLIGTMIYFSVNHSYVDQYRLNWYRIIHFISFIWLNNIYLQSFGQLWSVIFFSDQQQQQQSSDKELAIIIGMFFFQSTFLFNGFMIENPNRLYLMKIFSYFLPVKIISNGLMYSFYGIDRNCPKLSSIVLDDFDVQIDHIYSDILIILIHCLLARLLTYMIMLIKFFGFKNFYWPKKFQPFNGYINPFDNDDVDNNNRNEMKIEMIKINSTNDENQIQTLNNQDNQENIIIAWRSIYLFTSSNTIYEIRSINNFNIDNNEIMNKKFHIKKSKWTISIRYIECNNGTIRFRKNITT